jgi:phospholipid transport system transporter-binding protein
VNRAQLDSAGEGRFRVSGVLDATTVKDVLEQSEKRFAAARSIEVDLSGVSESDSAGLALVIEWLRSARERGQTIRFQNFPAQMQALARISEVEQLLVQNGASAEHEQRSPEAQPG